MRRFTSIAVTLVATFGLAIGCASTSDSPGLGDVTMHEPDAKWNQERVTAIAVELSAKCSELRQVFRQEPSSTVGSGQSHSFYQLKQLTRRIESEARHLERELAAGGGREETLPIYANLLTSVRDAQEQARRTYSSDHVLAAATGAGDVLRRLGPYYGPRLVNPPRS